MRRTSPARFVGLVILIACAVGVLFWAAQSTIHVPESPSVVDSQNHDDKLLQDLIQRVQKMQAIVDTEERMEASKAALTPHASSLEQITFPERVQAVLRQIRYWESNPKMDLAELQRLFPRRPDHYLLFELDNGGLNNIRLGFEHNVVVALLTGRTLVIPPRMRWYLLDWGGAVGWDERQNAIDHKLYKFTPPKDTHTSEIWDVTDLCRAISCISTEDFIEKMRVPLSIPASFGPVSGGVNSHPEEGDHGWSTWYRANIPTLDWFPFQRVVYWPGISSVGAADISNEFKVSRLPVEYTKEQENQPALLMESSHKKGRYLGPVAGFVAFKGGEFGELARATRRFLRDAVHWHPTTFEIAAHVIAQLGGVFAYTSMHIRRGDLQYAEAKTSATATMGNLEYLVPVKEGAPKPIIYMATDENDHSFFDVLHQRYTIYQFRDFFKGEGGKVLKHYAKEKGIDRRRVGQVEMIICAAGKLFVSSTHSTFSAGIQKLHGYLGAPDQNVYHHTHKEKPQSLKNVARTHRVRGTEYMTENPIQWEEV